MKVNRKSGQMSGETNVYFLMGKLMPGGSHYVWMQN